MKARSGLESANVNSSRIREVDGIRALALLGVLIYHGRFGSFFSGGFLGVDVFFVISGYVITLSLRKSFHRGSFSLREFMLRRLLRLTPALLVTLFLSNFFVMFLGTKDQRLQASSMSLGSLFSFSNFQLWMQSNYFDVGARKKPYLHTWSLSVEWQFYLTWAILLQLLLSRVHSKKIQVTVLALITLSSLTAAEMTRSSFPAAAFYMTSFRFCEFMSGTIPAWYEHDKRESEDSEKNFASNTNILRTSLSFVSVFSLLVLMNIYDDDVPFPGVYAVPICVVTTLLISFSSGTIIGSFLLSSVMQWLGKISYSVYLVHWPAHVLYYFSLERNLTSIESAVITISSVFLGHILHKLVEEPFQDRKWENGGLSREKKLLVLGIVFSFFVAEALYMRKQYLPMSPKRPEVLQFIQHSWEFAASRGEEIRSNCRSIGRHDNLHHFDKCNPVSDQEFVLMGDSHACDLWYTLNATFPTATTIELCGTKCGLTRLPETHTACYKVYNSFQEILEKRKERIKAVFLVSRWHAIRYDSIPDTYLNAAVEYFQKNTRAKIFLFGPRPAFKPHPNEVFEISGRRKTVDELERKADSYKFIESGAESDLAKYANEKGIEFVSVPRLMCNATEIGQDPSEYFCPTVDREIMSSLYCDISHYNQLGSRKLIQKLKGKILNSMKSNDFDDNVVHENRTKLFASGNNASLS